MDDMGTVTDEQIRNTMVAMREVAQLYNTTFKSETGQKVLKHLTDMTEGSSLSGNDLMDANVNVSPSEFMFIREGQDQAVRFIKRMIKYYEEN